MRNFGLLHTMISTAPVAHSALEASASFWITILGLLVGGQYFIAPILLRMKRGQLLSQLEPATDLPDHLSGAQTHLDAVAGSLSTLGFVPAPPGLPLVSTTNRAALVQMHVHPEHGSVATVIAVETPRGQLHTVLGFTTEFTDGTACYTGNSRLPAPVPARPGHMRNRFPIEHQSARVYALHRAAQASIAGKVARAIPIDDGVAYQLDQERRSRQWMVDCGYYWIDGERLRPTWKGACLGVWRHLPPWRTLAERTDERARRALLTSLGMPPTPPS